MRCWDKEEKAMQLQKIQLEEINQKVLAKEGRQKWCRDRTKQYRQNKTFQKNARKIYQQLEEKVKRHLCNRMEGKQNCLGAKYGNGFIMTKKPNRFWFKKSTYIHDSLANEMNWCLQETYIPEWMTKGKNHPDPKKTIQRNCPQLITIR